MIKVQNGAVYLEGSTIEISVDFGSIIWALVDTMSEPEVRELFDFAIVHRKKPEETIDMSKYGKEGKSKWDSLKF
jgi:hypothetical protein